jgi:ELWxxDGT repeat protein
MAKKGGKIIAVDEVFGFWDKGRVTVKDDRLYIRSYYEGTIEYDIDTETKINFATASTQFYFVGDKLYATEIATQKLYVFDSKTKKKSYILPEQLSAVSSLMPYKGKLYFAAIADGDKGKELYSYDPNADKLDLVEDYYEGKDHSYPTALQMQKNLLFFEITRGENVGQYVYDGINSPLLLSEYLNLEDGMEVCKVVNAQVKDKLLILISPSHDQLCGLYIFDINTHSSKLIDSHPDRIAQMFDAQNENTVYYLTGYYSDSYLRWKQVLYRYDILTEKLSIVHADIKSIPIFYASSLLFSAYDELLYTHSYNYSTQSYGLNEIYFGPDVVAEEVNNDWLSLGNKLYFPGVHRDYGYSLLSFYANTSAEGSVDINGSPVAGAQLTAGMNITDIDGVGALTFQWLRNSEKIPDADSQTYTVTGEDFEHEITVEVSYYDNEGNFELVVSNPVIILIDTDGDGIADATDTDDDNDGVLDTVDAFPLDVSESVDTDSDGKGNNADTDDDNDGVLDTVDAFPLDASRSDLVIVDDRKSSSGGSFGVLMIWLLAAYAFSRKRIFD